MHAFYETSSECGFMSIYMLPCSISGVLSVGFSSGFTTGGRRWVRGFPTAAVSQAQRRTRGSTPLLKSIQARPLGEGVLHLHSLKLGFA